MSQKCHESVTRCRESVAELSRGVAGCRGAWHRKSKKIVLAIVALKMGDDVLFVRGCNLEVSMPSGSLCAERNAIGTALTMYPGMGRADFRGVAVLSLTDGEDNINPLPPCGVCSEWLEKMWEE